MKYAISPDGKFVPNRLMLPEVPVTVKTAYGQLVGKTDQYGVTIFLGIPYAKAPVGHLRWRPPVALEPSNAVIQCFNFGPTPVQRITPFEESSYTPQGEDCLSLNIWTRDVNVKGKAVMVFIYGGSFVGGGTADPLYNGENFVRRNDIVIVTINYRVGVLGFLNLTEFGGSRYADSPNLGLLDQILALKWVRENISKFGGNPNCVTIFGESAGAASVSLLMTMPDAKGLFQKAIAESGTNYWVRRDVNYSKQVANTFIKLTGAKSIKDLLALSTDEIRTYGAQLHDMYFPNETYCFPLVDGRSIPIYPPEAQKNGAAADIKLLTGTNEDEVYFWKPYMQDFIRDATTFGNVTYKLMGLKIEKHQDIINQFLTMPRTLNTSEQIPEIALVTELGFRMPVIKMAEAQSKYNDTYMYYFRWKSPVAGNKSIHVSELPFVFYNLNIPSEAQWVGKESDLPASLAADMQDAWVAFAVTGNPSHIYIPEWPNYDVIKRATMIIDDKKWEVVYDPGKAERILLDYLFKDI